MVDIALKWAVISTCDIYFQYTYVYWIRAENLFPFQKFLELLVSLNFLTKYNITGSIAVFEPICCLFSVGKRHMNWRHKPSEMWIWTLLKKNLLISFILEGIHYSLQLNIFSDWLKMQSPQSYLILILSELLYWHAFNSTDIYCISS